SSSTLTDVKINDPIPFFSDLVTGAYTDSSGDSAEILWQDASGNYHYLTAAADNDEGQVANNLVQVNAEDSLTPGQGGEVCYRVEIR
ncbi:MAG: hypothetical protein GXN93_02785, partial [Candidatus Diapherotrites archaeon]|nr:hypothetical protein [Candidatus Diapherotrites archaeon]